MLTEEHFQVVHTHNRDGDVAGLVAAKKARTPLIVSTIHAYINKDKLGNRKMNFPLWKYNRILKKVPHKIITLSEALRTHILEELRISPERVVTILNGVDLGRLKISSEKNRVKKELGIPEGAKVVGSMGHLIALKGYKYLIEASVEVIKVFPDTRFVMVGEGNLRGELEELAEELKVRENFVFTGKISEVGNILQILDMFVHTSLSEGLPRAVMEASGLGIPVVATNVGGIPEVVRDKET
ncbi:MAG: glycosyltransferase, partial [Caldiserica bacterium]|nr:glycosyltransferase [Caldisericota bacterium]